MAGKLENTNIFLKLMRITENIVDNIVHIYF